MINGDDMAMVRRHIIGEDKIRCLHVNALIDSGAINLCINKSIQEILQFPIVEKKAFQTATGELRELQVIEKT